MLSETLCIVNYDVISDPELSIQAKGLYSTLSLFANNKREYIPQYLH